MATSPPKSNQPYTSTYYNQNQCRSFNQYVTTAVKVLTGAAPVGTAAGTAILSGGQPCSEVILYNKTGQIIYIYDHSFTSANHRLALDDNDTITLRGLTNVNQVSAATSSGAGTLYYRTQFFSSNPAR